MPTYKARAIVLHTLKYGESAMVAYLLTDRYGRMNYMVQGVHGKRGGNKAALFQPMFLVEFEGVEQPHARMHRIREVRSLYPLRTLPFDVRKSTISLFMAEVLYRLIRESEANQPLFDFVLRAVVALDRMEEGVSNFHLWFMVQLSSFLGFYPGNEPMARGWFDIRGGVFTSSLPSHGMVMDPESSMLLGTLMAYDPDRLKEIALGHGQRSAFLEAMLLFFGYHLDAIHKVQSIAILREVF
ncbi:MAG: DNA repair protein RecO [Alistipes sp.]|nr:DNA repair protein RecO [Alistipes sp.]